MFELIIKSEKQTKYIMETIDELYTAISHLQFKMFTLTDNDIQKFPYHLFSNLTSLIINMANISLFPKEITYLEKLQILELNNTDFHEFPDVITQLTTLTSLSFFQNYIQSIPDTFVNLSNLESVSFIHCRFYEFPSCLLELHKLRELYFCGNEKISIPHEISKLSNLERLGLHSNKITDIPTSIFKLKKLEFLDLSSNDIRSIPTSIEKLKNLEELILSGNRQLQNCLFLNLPNLERLVLDRHITDIILNEKVENNIVVTNGFHNYNNTIRFINELERINLLRQMKRDTIESSGIIIPDRIKCSICYSILFQPRVNQQGNIYCNSCIQEHYRTQRTDPLTNVISTTTELFPVHIIENEVNTFIDNFHETE